MAVALSAAMALGSAAPAGASPRTAAGSRAALAPTLNDSLNGVSCESATACMAVGLRGSNFTSMFPLAERWNGVAWSVVATPQPAGTLGATLSAVSCLSPTSCTAVGYYAAGKFVAPLIERWNGTRWQVAPSPNPGPGKQGSFAILLGAACTSAKACVAVGCFDNFNFGCVATFAENWNGTRWAIDPVPAGGLQLSGVACAASFCMAVGNSAQNGLGVTWTERWDGHAWSVVPSPNPPPRANARPALAGVSCAAVSCIAVGNGFSEGWDGTRWTILPAPARIGEMSGVSCSSADACTAVGNYQTGTGTTLTVGLRWSGAAWSLQHTADPKGTIVDGLFGISCPSATSCTAVGSNINDQRGNSLTMAEGWDGTTWALESTPSPAG